MENKKKKDGDKFTQGFICAVVCLINLNGEVDTRTRELFACCYNTIAGLKKAGCDTHDIVVIKKYWKELKSKK